MLCSVAITKLATSFHIFPGIRGWYKNHQIDSSQAEALGCKAIHRTCNVPTVLYVLPNVFERYKVSDEAHQLRRKTFFII